MGPSNATMVFMRLLPLAFLMTSACASSATSAPPPPEPRRVAIDDARLRALATNTARGSACRALRGRYMPVRDESSRLIVGRWLIDDCRSSDSVEPFAFNLSLHGRGWRHVRKAESGVSVDDYTRFDGSVSSTEIVDVAPNDGRHLSLLFTPRDTTASFHLTRPIDHRTTSMFTSTLDLLGFVDVDSRVQNEANTRGAAILLSRATEGRAVTFDTCTGQVSTSDSSPSAAGEGLTIEADRVRIEKASAIDVAGPFMPRDQPLRFDVHVSDGGRVTASIMCAPDAASVIAEWLDHDRAPPGVTPGGTLFPRQVYATTERNDACPLVLVTRAVDAATMLSYRVSVARPDATCR